MRRKNKMYKYFVSYALNKNNSQSGFGSCDVDIPNKIKNIGDVIFLQQAISEKHHIEVVIINWKLYDKNEEEE
jgi:hypothetical protein